MNLYANQKLYLSQITQIHTDILSHPDLADFFKPRIHTDSHGYLISRRSRRSRRFLDEHALGDDREYSRKKTIVFNSFNSLNSFNSSQLAKVELCITQKKNYALSITH